MVSRRLIGIVVTVSSLCGILLCPMLPDTVAEAAAVLDNGSVNQDTDAFTVQDTDDVSGSGTEVLAEILEYAWPMSRESIRLSPVRDPLKAISGPEGLRGCIRFFLCTDLRDKVSACYTEKKQGGSAFEYSAQAQEIRKHIMKDYRLLQLTEGKPDAGYQPGLPDSAGEEESSDFLTVRFLTGVWENDAALAGDPDSLYALAYYTEFCRDGGVIQTGYRNMDIGTYQITGEDTVTAVFVNNLWDSPETGGYQRIDGYSYTVTYTYDADNHTLYANYSDEFEEAANSNAGDGFLYKQAMIHN